MSIIQDILAYFMPAATTTELGGVYKAVGMRNITDAPTAAQFNALLDSLRVAGVMEMGGDPIPAELRIEDGPVPQAKVGVAYQHTFLATGGTPPYSWAVSAGGLPAGMTLSPGGKLQGTPLVAETTGFIVEVTDSESDWATRIVCFSVAPGDTPPPEPSTFKYDHSKNVMLANYSLVPNKGESVVVPTTGATLKRVTDAATDTTHTAGALVVYSRYPAVSVDSQYVLVHGEDSSTAWVIRRADGVVVNADLRDANGTLGENNELRWDYSGNWLTRLYFVRDMKFCAIDILTNVVTVLRDFSADFPLADYIANDVEGDSSNDSDVWCWMAMVRATQGSYYPVSIFSYSLSANAIVGFINASTPGVLLGNDSGPDDGSGRMTRPNMVEAIPDGSGVVIHWNRAQSGANINLQGTHQDGPHAYNMTFDINSAVKVAVDSTHAGWALANGSKLYFVSQNNTNDFIEACDLVSGYRSDGVGVIRMINHGDMGWNNGFHFSKMFTKEGWILASTYSSTDSDWGDNQMVMLSIEPNCKVLRVSPTYTAYPGNDAYRNESQGAVDVSGNIVSWTSNFGDNFDRRQVVEVVLPDDWNTHQ